MRKLSQLSEKTAFLVCYICAGACEEQVLAGMGFLPHTQGKLLLRGHAFFVVEIGQGRVVFDGSVADQILVEEV